MVSKHYQMVMLSRHECLLRLAPSDRGIVGSRGSDMGTHSLSLTLLFLSQMQTQGSTEAYGDTQAGRAKTELKTAGKLHLFFFPVILVGSATLLVCFLNDPLGHHLLFSFNLFIKKGTQIYWALLLYFLFWPFRRLIFSLKCPDEMFQMPHCPSISISASIYLYLRTKFIQLYLPKISSIFFLSFYFKFKLHVTCSEIKCLQRIPVFRQQLYEVQK